MTTFKGFTKVIALIIWGLIASYGNEAKGQVANCGTNTTAYQLQLSDSLLPWLNAPANLPEQIVQVPIQIHVVRQNNGSGGPSTSAINTALSELNSDFVGTNLSFSQCASINYIDNSTYYNYSQSQENSLANSNDVANVINVYIVNDITSSTGSSLCGYTYLPSGADRIFMDKSCLNTGHVLSHEFGHYFNLYHTHATSNTGTTTELVNGSNCSYAGDRLCDTPADPNLQYNSTLWVNSNCNYTGSFIDINGQSYAPSTSNIMSYTRHNCVNAFTSNQLNRMANAYTLYRNYLSCSSQPPSCQCPITSNQYPSSTLLPTTSWQTNTCQYAGEYSKYAVTSGETYTWSYCSSDGGMMPSTVDLRLNLYNDANLNYIICATDICGYAPRITWTATFTGHVRVLTNQFFSGANCSTNLTCADLVFKKSGGSTTQNPNLTCVSILVDDDNSGGSSGNGNGMPEAGESIEVDHTISNIGLGTAHNIDGKITCSSPYITITDDDVNFSDLAPGASDTGVDYDFDIAANCPSGTVITFYVTITADEGTWTCSFDITVGGNPTPTYQLTTNPNPSNAGTITGGGSYPQGTNINISVTPNGGFTFINVTDGSGSIISSTPNFNYTVNANATLTANFNAQPQNVVINTSSNPTNGGTITGGGSYPQGTNINISVTPNSGFTFINVTDGSGSIVSSTPNFNYTVNANTTLIANFNAQPQTVNINTNSNPTNGGILQGGGTYTIGSTVNLSTTTNNGYAFNHITNGSGVVVSTALNYSFVATQNENYTAHFTVVPNTSLITVLAEPSTLGAVTGGATYTNGLSVTVTATPNPTRRFLYWKNSQDVVVSTSPTYQFSVQQNEVFTAYFDFATNTIETIIPEYKIYPNPANELLNIEGSDNIKLSEFTIYNTIGQVIINKQVLNQQPLHTITIAGLSKGSYILQLTTEHGKQIQKRFIKL